MKLLIGGDFVINQTYNLSQIDLELIKLFESSDINIVNLEAPITASSSKIIKTGPHLKSEEHSTLNVLKSLKIDLVTLANNHVLDYDEKGVKNTLDFCKNNGIQSVGAGKNKEEASKTIYIETNEGKIALVNFAENEWASATDNSAGANPMNIIDNTNQIKEAKKKADYVILIIHGGHEYYNLPSPSMQKQYRFYADQGADLIVGHHTHCISGYEIHNGVPIYYSLGNMLFTKHSKYPDWYKGIILEVNINKRKVLKIDIHPIGQNEKSFDLELLCNDEKTEIVDRVNLYSNIIKDFSELNANWNNFVEKETLDYLGLLSPKSFISNKYLRGSLGKLGIKLNNKRGNSLLLNMLRCEAHRDISIEVIKSYLIRNKSI